MEPLVTTRQCLTWICMCPADESTSRWQKTKYTLFAVTTEIGLMCICTPAAVYFLKYISIDLGRSVFAFMFVVATFTAFCMGLIGMISLPHKIGRIFENLSKIYKDNEHSKSFRFLERVNNTNEWLWQMFFRYTGMVFFMNFAVAPLISVLFAWYTDKNLNVDNFFHPLPLVLPWNQTTLVGYAVELTTLGSIGLFYFVVYGTFLMLFLSICMHHQAFSKMFKYLVDKLNRSDVENQCDKKSLCNLIRFHISVKNWFLDTAKVYSSLNAIQFISSFSMLAMSIFYMDYQVKQRSFSVMSAITTVSLGLTNLLIYCYLGKLATESYAKMSDCVYNMNWYELPIELQKYFILIIANVQKPLYYHGCGVFYLNLETYTKLIRSAITFYMAIKAMTLE